MCRRVQVLIDYLQSEEKSDPALLRSIKNICDSLPVVDATPEFQKAFLGEMSDSLLMTECAAMTRAAESTQVCAEVALCDALVDRLTAVAGQMSCRI